METMFLLALFGMAFAVNQNLNGDYFVSSGARQKVAYNTDYASKGMEYFDVYSKEIATHYGQVYWTDQGSWPLPEAIITRFKDKVMAITGYEYDQVMVQPVGQPGVNPAKDVSVPINWAYNHHYGCNFDGAATKLQRIDPAQMKMTKNTDIKHSAQRWVSVPDPEYKGIVYEGIPTSTWFSEGNGGEARKSYHGYPTGYAQLIQSPASVHLSNVMQIDTRNRECGVTPDSIHNCTDHFVPGPEPKQARYGRGTPTGTNYSGLIECPCSSTYGGDPEIYPGTKTKQQIHNYGAIAAPKCAALNVITTAASCFQAAVVINLPFRLVDTSNQSVQYPAGCSVATQLDGTAQVNFNGAASTTACSASKKLVGQASVATLNVSLGLVFNLTTNTVQITVTGPANVWFGIGFNAAKMADQPWALISSASGVIEQELGTCTVEGKHCAGTSLAASVTVLSNNVAKNVRTVVVTRPLAGKGARYYTFNPSTQATIPFIAAIGSSQVFSYHAAHAASTITAIAVDGTANCICDSGADFDLCMADGSSCGHFTRSCVEDLLRQENPTCSSRTYSGGLACCRHLETLLDTDQTVPPQLLQYHQKYRVWFQDYTAANATTNTSASHANLDRLYMTTEAFAGEYDVPPAFATPGLPILGYPDWPLNTPTPGTSCTGTCPGGADCQCVHTLIHHFPIAELGVGGPVRIIYAGGHCHAPSCIDIALYRNDTGVPELLCLNAPSIGQGDFPKDKFDEAGYAYIPPCLWGDEGDLDKSFLIPQGTPMFSVKRNHNTDVGHYGEMASWQMRGVQF